MAPGGTAANRWCRRAAFLASAVAVSIGIALGGVAHANDTYGSIPGVVSTPASPQHADTPTATTHRPTPTLRDRARLVRNHAGAVVLVGALSLARALASRWLSRREASFTPRTVPIALFRRRGPPLLAHPV